MKDGQNVREELINEIVKLFADNKISYSEAGEIMYCIKKKMGGQLDKIIDREANQ